MSPEKSSNRTEQLSITYGQFQNHLAAVAEETLRVQDGEFVHTSLMGVVRSVRERIANGVDPRLLGCFEDRTISRHIFLASQDLIGEFSSHEQVDEVRLGHMPLASFAKDEETFNSAIESEGWRQTLEALSETLPEGTTTFDIVFLLLNASKVDRIKSVEDRIKAIKTEDGTGYK